MQPLKHTSPDHGEARAYGRVCLRIAEVAASLGINRRTLERERAAGRFPAPDLVIGKMPLWRPETIQAWIEKGGRV